MNKFEKIRYIIVDLDDTLLTHDKKLSKRTIKTLKKARKFGYKIVFNTSRSLQNSYDYATKLNIDFGIFSGGCHIVNEFFRDLYSETIPTDEVNVITKKLLEFCPKISVQTKTHFYASDKDYKGQNAIHYDFKEPLEEDAYKILCLSKDHKTVENLAKEYNLEYQNYLNRGWHRLSVKGANKWNGVLRFLQIVKGKPEECMCFGDDFGDLDMILKAGVGVAMANSQPEVLDKAPYVCDNNDDDGVAKFIEHFLFNKTRRAENRRTHKKVKQAFHLKKKNKTLPKRLTPEELGLAPYTLAQELWNSITHGIGAIFGVAFLVLLLVKTLSNPSDPFFGMKLYNAIYYPFAVITCMTISCVYHALAKNRGKRVMRVIDHAMIYLLVAGTYAPYCLVAMPQSGALLWNIPGTEWSSYAILAICYTCIIVGATLSSVNIKKFKVVSFVMYLVGGLIILINPTGIYQSLDLWGFLLLAFGGVFYVVGSVLYAVGKRASIWWHTVFHFLSLAGVVSMFFSIYFYVF